MFKKALALLAAGVLLLSATPAVYADFNDSTVDWGDHTVHTYDGCLDTGCNVCGELREVTDHVYDHECDPDCNVCGAVRANVHRFDNACDATCNVTGCDHVREVPGHRYDHACDADCNVCGVLRQVGDHTYTNGCDETCNLCGFVREVDDHTYANGCDTDCDLCGFVRTAGDHVYDGISDPDCNECGARRGIATIVTQPKQGNYAPLNGRAETTVIATGDGLTYQWYIRNATGTKYSKSSLTGPTYYCTMTEKSHNRRAYCIITDRYGNQVTTQTIILRIQATVTKEPATAAYAKQGATAKVSITAVGDGLSYTWYIKNANGTKYSKSSITTNTYSVTMSDKAHGRRIYCVVKDKYGKKVQTKTFILRMQATVVTQPKTVTVAKGKTAKVTVKAVGDGLTYQWYIKNDGATKYSKSSVTKASYSVTMTNKVAGRRLYCVVKDKYGKTVQTSTVRLKMK